MTDNDYAALDDGYDEYDHKAIDAELEAEVTSRVKRYTESCMEVGGVVPDSNGELVDWSDYVLLEAELEETLGDWGTVRLELAAAKAEIRQIRSGWLRAVDDNMTSSHIGVANACDTYHEARKKLSDLIEWHVQVATDPCVNGGFVLVQVCDG